MQFREQCARRKCGECCGIIRLPETLVTRHREAYQQEPEKEIRRDGKIIVVTRDLRCVFLTGNGECAVYEDRPGVCRMYGETLQQPCPYLTKDGKHRHREDTRRIKRLIRDEIQNATPQNSN